MISQVKPEACMECPEGVPPEGADERRAADGARRERYALVVVLEAESPDSAWEAVRKTAGRLQGDGEPDCVYIGAPWRGIPAEAEDLSTDHLELAMFVPNGGGNFVPITAVLRSCG